MNDVIFKLTELGFSSYEAKAYFALLQKNPTIGYEVSKIAKIPTSKIYETLTNLKNKGAIISSSSEPIYYSPVDPKILLEKIKYGLVTKIDDLENQLKLVQPIPNIDITWNLPGYQTVIEKIIDVIKNASKFLLLSIWPEEAAIIKDYIILAQNRGVKVIAGVFGDYDIGCRKTINLETCGVTSKKRLGKHLTVVIGDSKEVIISEIGGVEDTVGVWTNTASVILTATEYIKHDIWGKVLIDTVGIEKFNDLCSNNDILSYLIENR
ncbi:MAG: helix-turn-helix domain-containing protein [Bacillota bacterium]|nr:helix-turn-helix domain-containing protein [Bacillota bacterium]